MSATTDYRTRTMILLNMKGKNVENKKIWDQLKTPPQSAMSKIKGGRLKGKTDISPQWRYEIMTEVFGPCGVGWRFSIDRMWTEPASDGQVFAFSQITLTYKVDSEWSGPIYGVGGSMLVAKESGGLHSSDEAFKMATTDALGTALKMIGVAADVYAGKFDGKYPANPAPKPKDIDEPDFVTNEPPAIKSKPAVAKKFKALKKMDEIETACMSEVMLGTTTFRPKDLNVGDFKRQRAIDIFTKFKRWPKDSLDVTACLELIQRMYRKVGA